MRIASNCRHVSGSDEGVTLLHLLCCSGRPGRLIGRHISGGSATGDGTGFPSKMRAKASFAAQKNEHYSISLSVQVQGNLMHMFIPKNSAGPTSGYTNALIKQAIVGAAGQNQLYDVLRHSMRTHREKLSSLDTTGFSVAIPLSSRYYTSATVWLQGSYCPDNCTNFFDNCVFCMLQLFESGSSLSPSVRGWLHVAYCSCR